MAIKLESAVSPRGHGRGPRSRRRGTPGVRYSTDLAHVEGYVSAADRLVLYGGRERTDGASSLFTIEPDLYYLNYDSATWTKATGYAVPRCYHSSVSVGDEVVVFGGFYNLYTRTSQGVRITGHVINDVLSSNVTSGACKSGLWCYFDYATPAALNVDVPYHRYGQSAVKREDDMIIFGGRIPQGLVADVWAVDLTAATSSAKTSVVDENYLLSNGGNNSALYFLYVVLAMMLVSFLIFFVSIRRSGGDNAVARAFGMGPVQRGLSPDVIARLPTKTYAQSDADQAGKRERRSVSHMHRELRGRRIPASSAVRALFSTQTASESGSRTTTRVPNAEPSSTKALRRTTPWTPPTRPRRRSSPPIRTRRERSRCRRCVETVVRRRTCDRLVDACGRSKNHVVTYTFITLLRTRLCFSRAAQKPSPPLIASRFSDILFRPTAASFGQADIECPSPPQYPHSTLSSTPSCFSTTKGFRTFGIR